MLIETFCSLSSLHYKFVVKPCLFHVKKLRALYYPLVNRVFVVKQLRDAYIYTYMQNKTPLENVTVIFQKLPSPFFYFCHFFKILSLRWCQILTTTKVVFSFGFLYRNVSFSTTSICIDSISRLLFLSILLSDSSNVVIMTLHMLL